MENIWQLIQGEIQKNIPQQAYKIWLEPIKFLSFANDTLELCIPNAFYEEWINDYYLGSIKTTLSKILGKEVNILFRINQSVPLSGPLNGNSSSSVQIPLGIPISDATPHALEENKGTGEDFGEKIKTISFAVKKGGLLGDSLNPKYTFENFVVGTSNQFSHAASFAVAEQPATHYNPLFIFGGVGLGKTHLLNAIGHHILNKSRGHINICYISSERFINELVNCLRYEKMELFRKKYRESCDVLLMDDIQFIAGKDKSQEEFFHTFNTLHGLHKQIVMTSDRFPKDINNLDDRLRSRFEWGLIADIQPPDLETRIAILKNKASFDDIYLPDDVAFFLASKITSNVRELEGSLIRIGAFSSLTGMEITVSLAKDVLKNILREVTKEINIDYIVKHIASYFDVKIIDLKSKKKLKHVTMPRQIGMYLCRKLTNKSFPEIGAAFGGKDHSTVIYAVKKVEETKSTDPGINKTIQELTHLIEA